MFDYVEQCESEYDAFLAEMDYECIWVPNFGETFYVPLMDAVECWKEHWHGYLEEQEWCRSGLVFKTPKEALEKARQDLGVNVSHV